MTPLAQAKLVGCIVLLALIGAGLWYLHHDGYEAGKTEVQAAWEAEKLKAGEAQKAALLAYAEESNKPRYNMTRTRTPSIALLLALAGCTSTCPPVRNPAPAMIRTEQPGHFQQEWINALQSFRNALAASSPAATN